MNDTPKHIQQKQLEIWLSKTPAERLRQAITDNDALFKFWNAAKKQIKESKAHSATIPNGSIAPVLP